MTTSQIVVGCICGALAIGLGVYTSFAARQKGPILSNTYLWLSKEEKAKLSPEKKAKEYRLVRNVFGMLSLLFTFETIYILTTSAIALIFAGITLGIVMIYAVVDGVKSFNS